MKFDKWFLLGVAAILITAFLWGARWYRTSETKRTESIVRAQAELLVRPYSPWFGSEGASVTIVEFLDPECESCRLFYPVVKAAMKEFDGKVRLVVRYMPLHKNSAYAVSVLEASRKQGKYWEALELFFVRQSEWASHHAPRPELLLDYARDLGLDIERLKASLQDVEIESKIRQDQEDGKKLGVVHTPAFFINGKMLQKLGYNEFRSAIEMGLR